ncbi:hypothetical protein BD626DRAFT_532742 [Schizophyllum amplum]|uniref:Uncharacterized protein n=1 Tax=Schizophyllum amplum TaxID=97359 RepID=A0A550CVI9_9AGAR|nr:hypothetical protein BD626DRAFT_532742 [Auriculariopsis ampla]
MRPATLDPRPASWRISAGRVGGDALDQIFITWSASTSHSAPSLHRASHRTSTFMQIPIVTRKGHAPTIVYPAAAPYAFLSAPRCACAVWMRGLPRLGCLATASWTLDHGAYSTHDNGASWTLDNGAYWTLDNGASWTLDNGASWTLDNGASWTLDPWRVPALIMLLTRLPSLPYASSPVALGVFLGSPRRSLGSRPRRCLGRRARRLPRQPQAIPRQSS